MKVYCTTKAELERIKKTQGLAMGILANLEQHKIDPVKRHNDTVNLLNEQARLKELQHLESAARDQTVINEFDTAEMLDNQRINWRQKDK